jgi:Glycosyl hydrolase catalytic core
VTGDPEDLNCRFYYNYHSRLWDFNIRYNKCQFIPMMKDPSRIRYVRKGSAPPIVFTFNEPDVPTSSSYMPIKDLITNYWPAIEATKAVEIVAPSFTKKRFTEKMKEFVAGNGTYIPYFTHCNVHWHDLDAHILLRFVDNAWRNFGKPIYVTEFSMADWYAQLIGVESNQTREAAISFIHVAINGFESRPFIHGYAYFSSLDDQVHEFGSLWNANRTVRPAGWVYAGYSSTYSRPSSLNYEESKKEPKVMATEESDSTLESETQSIEKSYMLLAIFIPVSLCIASFFALCFYRRIVHDSTSSSSSSDDAVTVDDSAAKFEEPVQLNAVKASLTT